MQNNIVVQSINGVIGAIVFNNSFIITPNKAIEKQTNNITEDINNESIIFFIVKIKGLHTSRFSKKIL